MSGDRDITPALGSRGEPGPWQPAVEGADVALARPGFGDARASFLYGPDTHYSGVEPQPGEVAAANRRMRDGPIPADLRGPFLKPAVWTWEISVYFWLGGVASGSAFVGLAADLAGDQRSAAIARKVALAALLPAPVLLISDLGRPGRFLNMLRVFKPRSPMNLGVWCLAAFSSVGAGAVGADVLGRRRTARVLGGVNAFLGAYLGSYTGVLLAATAVPVWARSRVFLGPIFVSTATATGAAATRLALTAAGHPPQHPTRIALGRLETAAIVTELALSTVNERRLGRAGDAFSHGSAGRMLAAAKGLVGTGLALSMLGRRPGRHAAGVLYLAGGLAFRFAWIEAGKASARDDEAVALTARARGLERRALAPDRPPRSPGPAATALRTWSSVIGRASLVVERLLRRA